MGLFDKFRIRRNQTTLSKPISATYLQGFAMPGLGLVFVILAILLIITFINKSSPQAQLQNISYPYTMVSVVSSDTYVLRNRWGKEETVTITGVYDSSSFYNRKIEDQVLNREVYYKNNVIYYIDDSNEIQTVNAVVVQIIKDQTRLDETSATTTTAEATTVETTNYQVIIETTAPNGGF